jgi:hypothetical protein
MFSPICWTGPPSTVTHESFPPRMFMVPPDCSSANAPDCETAANESPSNRRLRQKRGKPW